MGVAKEEDEFLFMLHEVAKVAENGLGYDFGRVSWKKKK